MEERKIRVALTHGDTNGVGYELIFKTFENLTMLELCTPIIYGSPKVATYHRNALGIQTNFTIISQAEEAREGRLNLLTVFDEEIKVEMGTPTEESGNTGLRAIDRALEDFREGCFDVLVNAPLDNNDVFHFS
jgi:4-hydroxythreonine-4-phosphate dehydrogenase